jgi:hypothetical protein
MNWRGGPLTSHDIIVQSIAATTTRAGAHHVLLPRSTVIVTSQLRRRDPAGLATFRRGWGSFHAGRTVTARG